MDKKRATARRSRSRTCGRPSSSAGSRNCRCARRSAARTRTADSAAALRRSCGRRDRARRYTPRRGRRGGVVRADSMIRARRPKRRRAYRRAAGSRPGACRLTAVYPEQSSRPMPRGARREMTMPNYKLTIEYEGTRYSGWQAQGNTQKTVQGHLIRAASQVLGEVEVGGAGRTDAGVHAAAQVAHLRAKKAVDPLQLSRKINDLLPHDIHILDAQRANDRFH